VQNEDEDRERFIYSAYAQSIGATLEKPTKTFLTDGPGASLPITGGYISHTKEALHFAVGAAEIVRVGRASATVLGEERDDHFVSSAIATVEKLNILDIVTADRVVAKVTSLFPKRLEDVDTSRKGFRRNPAFLSDPEGDYHPAHFFISGSHFDNLKINGVCYDCKLESPEEEEAGFMVMNSESKRELIFKGEHHQKIPIRLFGTVHLGEKFKYGGKVVLSMIRVELGCPQSGSVSAANASANGKNGY